MLQMACVVASSVLGGIEQDSVMTLYAAASLFILLRRPRPRLGDGEIPSTGTKIAARRFQRPSSPSRQTHPRRHKYPRACCETRARHRHKRSPDVHPRDVDDTLKYRKSQET